MTSLIPKKHRFLNATASRLNAKIIALITKGRNNAKAKVIPALILHLTTLFEYTAQKADTKYTKNKLHININIKNRDIFIFTNNKNFLYVNFTWDEESFFPFFIGDIAMRTLKIMLRRHPKNKE